MQVKLAECDCVYTAVVDVHTCFLVYVGGLCFVELEKT